MTKTKLSQTYYALHTSIEQNIIAFTTKVHLNLTQKLKLRRSQDLREGKSTRISIKRGRQVGLKLDPVTHMYFTQVKCNFPHSFTHSYVKKVSKLNYKKYKVYKLPVCSSKSVLNQRECLSPKSILPT